jgi:hypothetical protein
VTFISPETVSDWLMLVASLAGEQGALRIRVWRSLKALGAASVRDGVYLLPDRDGLRAELEGLRAEIKSGDGAAYLFTLSNVGTEDAASLRLLFDRSSEYADLLRAIEEFVAGVSDRIEAEARRALRQIKRDFTSIETTDFFASPERDRVFAALHDAEAAFTRAFSPEEPSATRAAIPARDPAEFRGRTWATRRRMWVDRVASAWLVRRFIDPGARFLWLRHPADCPPSAVGFDFDGAAFTHARDLVTFEVLVESFGLKGDASLARVAGIVHQLDVGGSRVPEAAGVEAMLTGARERCADDDELLAHMSGVFDDLYTAFSQSRPAKVPAEV